MKRVYSFLSMAAVLAALIVVFGALERRYTPAWRVALMAYMEQGAAPSMPDQITVQMVDRASNPQNFRPHMGRPVPLDWQWTSVELPWPPEDLWCVLVKRGGDGRGRTGESKAHSVLFVGRHTDLLWRDGWVVHEGLAAPFTPQLEQDLSSLGCDLELDRFRQMEGGASASLQSARAVRYPATGMLNH